MTEFIAQVMERLREAHVVLENGLSVQEVAQVEHDYCFKFSVVHRQFLMTVLPVGPGWWDWRHGNPEVIRRFLKAPIEGVLFDVRKNDFWPSSWGAKPAYRDEQVQVAEARLSTVPQLIPVYSHRYMVSGLDACASPVFSVVQTDVVYYGDNLLDYVAQQFHVGPRNPSEPPHIPFWSDLAMGLEPDQM